MSNQNQLSLLYFGKGWDTGGEGINGHCFPLRHLISMNFFK